MKVLVDVSIVPIGVGVSLSRSVAACERIFREAGLKTALHANGTDVEGEWTPYLPPSNGATRSLHWLFHRADARHVDRGPTLADD